MNGGGHGAGVDGVADSEGGLEVAVGDSRFGFLVDQVEDGGSGGFGAGSCGRGHGDQGLQFGGDGLALANWGVDEVEEVGVGEGRVQIHQFGSVHDTSASHGEEGVWCVWLGCVDCFPYPVQHQ